MINEVILTRKVGGYCVGENILPRVTHTETVCHYKFIQITFCDVMGFSLSSENFLPPFVVEMEGNKNCDLDDEWLRYFREVKSTYERQ